MAAKLVPNLAVFVRKGSNRGSASGQPKDNTCFLCQPSVEILCVFFGGQDCGGNLLGGVSCMIFLRGKDWDMVYT